VIIRIKLNVCEKVLTERNGYNIKAADWDRFRMEIGQIFNGDCINGLRRSHLSVVINHVTELLNVTEACRRSIPGRKLRSRFVPWWSRELDKLRRDARCKRKQLARSEAAAFGCSGRVLETVSSCKK